MWKNGRLPFIYHHIRCRTKQAQDLKKFTQISNQAISEYKYVIKNNKVVINII